MRKFLCPHCNEAVDLDPNNQLNECPNCRKVVDTTSAINNTQAYINQVLKNANQYFDSAYSYEEAYKYFNEFLQFEPTHLDAILGKLLSLFRTSTLKKNVFTQVVEEFNSADISLEKSTYIRIGHFFNELMGSTFLFQKRILEFIEHASDAESEIALNTLVDLLAFYDFIYENISMFTDEEYVDSIFISKDELMANKDKLIKYMVESNHFKFDAKSLGSAEIFVNNKKLLHNEFDINTYEDVVDFAFFDTFKVGLKSNYLTFAALIICTICVVVGLILGLTLGDLSWIGWTILGVFLVADVTIYILFTKKREKTIAQLNK